MLELADVLWKPHPKQALLLACPVHEVMWGGAKGGGKSAVLLLDHIDQHRSVHHRWEQNGSRNTGRALIVRKEFSRLKDIVNRAHLLIPTASKNQMTWKERDHWYVCACGYRLEFGHLESPQDHFVYQGQELSWLGFDQVEEIPFEQYAFLKLQVRASDPLLRPSLKVRCTANPGGRYGDWVKRRFIDPSPDGFQVITETVTLESGEKISRERVFIPATLADNPSLGPEYLAELMLAPEYMRRAYLYGDWNVTEGSFFGDVFDPNIHVIDDLGPTEVRIPSNWPVERYADWGARAPACVHWVAMDNDGMLIFLDELYGPGENATLWAKRIAAIEEKWGWQDVAAFPPHSKLRGYIDPSAMTISSTGGPSVADVSFENGITWWPADNERKAGWQELRRRLMERGGVSGQIPGIRITRRCKNLIRTLPNMVGCKDPSEGDMDDIDTRQEDHAVDCARYAVMARQLPRTKQDVEDEEIRKWERVIMSRQRAVEATRSSVTGY